MGNGETFSWFIHTVRTRYPSTHLAVSVWDHGDGWRGFATDDSSGGDSIDLSEFRTALRASGHIDVLAFDACDMASLEVAYEAAQAGTVRYLVASEEVVPENGFPYDLMLTPLAKDPSGSPARVTSAMVAGWEKYYDARRWATHTQLAALDMAALRAAMPDLRAWVTLMRTDQPAYAAAMGAAARAAWSPRDEDTVDLGNFARGLSAAQGIADGAVKTASERLTADLRRVLLKQARGSGVWGATGLTIWLGTTDTWESEQAAYAAQVAFAGTSAGVGWWSFLSEYHR
jgi:hypothetical protein